MNTARIVALQESGLISKEEATTKLNQVISSAKMAQMGTDTVAGFDRAQNQIVAATSAMRRI